MSSYKDIKNATSEVSSNYGQCSVCSKSTLIATLSEYGARCFECYGVYCRTPTLKLEPSRYAASIATMRK